MTKTHVVRASLALTLMLAPGAAHAASISIYTNAADWQAALLGPAVTEDFSNAAIVPGPVTSTLGGLQPGLEIRATRSAVIDQGSYKDYVGFGPGFGGPEDASLFTFDDSGAVAFAADWNLGQVFGGIALRVTFVDGTTGTSVLANPFSGTYNGFFGLVADSSIRTIGLSTVSFTTTAGQSFAMDNAQFVPTPEPATGLLVAAGLVGVVRRALKKQRA